MRNTPNRTGSTAAGRGGIDLLRRRTPWHARCRRNGTERSSVGTRLTPRTGHRGTGARSHRRSCIGVFRCPPASRSTQLCIFRTPGRSWGTIGSDFCRSKSTLPDQARRQAEMHSPPCPDATGVLKAPTRRASSFVGLRLVRRKLLFPVGLFVGRHPSTSGFGGSAR